MDNTFIANLLIELLSEYNRVSLPCLGSFVGQYKPAYFSEDGKTIYPPSKQIEFFQNEIWNDERLEKIIAEREGVSVGEAKEKLAFWIDGVCVRLSMGESVSLPNIGEFVVSYGNRLKFVQSNGNNLLLESFGFDAIELDIALPIPPQPFVPPVSNSNDAPKRTQNKYAWLRVILLSLVILFCVIAISIALIHFRIVRLPDTILEKYPSIENYLRQKEVNEQLLFPSNDDDEEFVEPIYTDENIVAEDTLTEQKLVADSAQLTMLDSVPITLADSIKHDTISAVVVPIEFFYIVVKTADSYDNARTSAKIWAKKGYVVQILYSNEEDPYKLSIENFKSEEEAINKLEEYKKEDKDFKNAFVHKYNSDSRI